MSEYYGVNKSFLSRWHRFLPEETFSDESTRKTLHKGHPTTLGVLENKVMDLVEELRQSMIPVNGEMVKPFAIRDSVQLTRSTMFRKNYPI